MSQEVIRVEDLSKLYDLGQVGTGTVTKDLNRWWAKARGKEDPYAKIGQVNDRTLKTAGKDESVWALRDINFSVNQGDVVGIIGRNGAGKSTLLKIISRITTPTSGAVKIKGRIASLLEVGTGFHPEMTGRENIFMNGTLMGMTRREIQNKFDEIVDFAGVAMYIDTPVKRYSSGMQVRLGFAVAAFLEPEILIVDEVLAVGDAEFQKKAIGRMKDVSRGDGRTVLFVSHNMAAVKSLCTKSVVLKNGEVLFDGGAQDGIALYQNDSHLRSEFIHIGHYDSAPGNENIRVLEFKVTPTRGSIISISSGITFELAFLNIQSKTNLAVTFELRSMDDTVVFHKGTWVCETMDSENRVYRIKGELDRDLLNAGFYKFNMIFGASLNTLLYSAIDFIQFEVTNETLSGNSLLLPGIIRPKIEFEIFK